jgi:hypothetical protein
MPKKPGQVIKLSRPGNDALSLLFGLSYASFFVLPRVLAEAMPDAWQGKIARLLQQYEDAWDTQELPSPAVLGRRGSRFAKWPEWLLNYRRPDARMLKAHRDKHSKPFIYMASKPEEAGRWKKLHDDGHEICSLWINDPLRSRLLRDVEKNSFDTAGFCFEQVSWADVLILVGEPRGLDALSLLEAGAAYGAGIPVIQVAHNPMIGPVVHDLANWHYVDTVEKALELAKELHDGK